MNQSTSNILMIRPVNFGFNEQTAGSNAFQNKHHNEQDAQTQAAKEFDAFVQTLRDKGVNVIVINDTPEPHTPDSIFPNNWVSFHDDGTVFLYPMQAPNRRLERRDDIITQLQGTFKINHIADLSGFESKEKFLEGTGSMVLDRPNKIAYACVSPRTDKEVLDAFCQNAGYKAVTFNAFDENGIAIYHTNVLMGIGTKFAVVCLNSITNNIEKQTVIDSIKSTGKKLIDISFSQMNQFAGNLLEVKNTSGQILIVMSKTAYGAFTDEQKSSLSKYGKLVYADINTIETIGGGSARCMMAEVHLPIR
ncbi:MAG: citrulline utilization hydrolase CtlX [Mucilaginibacter sp.]